MALDKTALPALSPEEAQAQSDRAALSRAFSLKNPLMAAGMDLATMVPRAVMGAANTTLRLPNALGAGIPYIPEAAFGGSSSSLTPYSDRNQPPAAPQDAPVTPAAPAAPPSAVSPTGTTPRASAPSSNVTQGLPQYGDMGSGYVRNDQTGATTIFRPKPVQAAAPVTQGLPGMGGSAPQSNLDRAQTYAAQGATPEAQATRFKLAMEALSAETAAQAHATAAENKGAGAQEKFQFVPGLPGQPATVFDVHTGKATEYTPPEKPTAHNINALRNNPALAAKFNQQFGAGAAEKILGQ